MGGRLTEFRPQDVNPPSHHSIVRYGLRPCHWGLSHMKERTGQAQAWTSGIPARCSLVPGQPTVRGCTGTVPGRLDPIGWWLSGCPE